MITFAANTPDYLPDLAFFYKMSQANIFAIADDIQFSTRSVVNRARIKSAKGAQWLTIPVLTKGIGKQLVKDLRIDNTANWPQKHRKTLFVNYNYSPYFEYYVDYFDAIYRKKWSFLIDLNLEIIELIRNNLGIQSPLFFTSECAKAAGATEKIIAAAKKIKANAYLAETADKEFLQPESFAKKQIALRYSSFTPLPYRQQFGPFLPGLSIVDLLFNEGPEARWILPAQNANFDFPSPK